MTLSSDELVKLSNVLYHAPDEDKNNLYYQLNSEIIIARDMCQYGHIDNFSLAKIIENREKIIIELRFGLNGDKPKTQNEIAKMMNISRSYVSRIESKAIYKLSKEITE